MTKIAHPKAEYEQVRAITERNEEKVTRVARATEKAGADAAHGAVQVAQIAGDAAKDLRETTHQLTQEAPEFGRALAELLGEQTRESVDALSTFARAVNWSDVAQAQGRLITSSIMRISQFNARYGQFLLRGMTAIPTSSGR